MKNNIGALKMHETLIDKIVEAKLKGVSDQEIGDKYGLSLREIEKAITKKFGINISNLNIKKEIKNLTPKNFKLETSNKNRELKKYSGKNI